VSALDIAIVTSSMVIAMMAGLYAGLGLNASQDLDRRAEIWFAVAMWTVALAGALTGDLKEGNLAIGLVMGGLVLLLLWSILHFPQIKTLETPMPRLAPMFTFGICLVTIVLLGLTIVLVDFL
jgi:hypothetical protein